MRTADLVLTLWIIFTRLVLRWHTRGVTQKERVSCNPS